MVSQGLIEEAKTKYNSELQNPLQIKMNLKCPVIRYKVPL